jgi:hypothetical protein
MIFITELTTVLEACAHQKDGMSSQVGVRRESEMVDGGHEIMRGGKVWKKREVRRVREGNLRVAL